METAPQRIFQTQQHNVRAVQPPLGLNEHGATPFASPSHNWTLHSDLHSQRRGRPHFLNGPVPSRMISTAVFHKGVFITPEDTGHCVSDSLKSTLHSAERRQMFEATTWRVAASQPRDDRLTSVQKFKQPQSTLSQLATRKSGKPTQYDRGENSPLEKNLQSSTALPVRTA